MLIFRTSTDRTRHDRFVLCGMHMRHHAELSLSFTNGCNGSCLFLIKITIIITHCCSLCLSFQLVLFLFKSGKFRFNIWINIVHDILSIHDLWNSIEAPFRILEIILFTVIWSPDTWSTILPHEFTSSFLPVAIFHVSITRTILRIVMFCCSIANSRLLLLASASFPLLLDRFRDEGISVQTIPCIRIEHLKSIHDSLYLLTTNTTFNPCCQKPVTCQGLYLAHSCL
mmetsp:Transcript_8025/g.9317  ORF Transcript_8025/g.9317 Transcript_8025/m.9317 type:complete len:227 (-) Transcript_8025:456-1136(-)